MNINIAPTKSNLLTTKEQLAVSTNGYELLEEKREIQRQIEDEKEKSPSTPISEIRNILQNYIRNSVSL